MKHFLFAICCLALCSVAASAGTTKAPMNDQKFLDIAAQTDMVDANLGQLAKGVGGTESVKDFGQMLVTDHTHDFEQLQSLAKQTGLTVPTAIDTERDKTTIAPMHALKGNAFDHKYIQDMVAGHEDAVALYKKEAKDAESPAIRSYAEDTLATLQKHLADAKAIEQGKTPSM